MQYHAFWQRLHHIDVGLQHNVQGWLMTGEMVFIMRRDVMYDEFGEMPWYLGAYGATSTPFKYLLANAID